MPLLAPETVNPSMLPALPFTERAKLPNVAAIYFVLDAEHDVLYIGRAKSLCFRWQNHHRIGDFRKGINLWIAYLSVTDAALLPSIEKALIAHFDPPVNRSAVDYARSKGTTKPVMVRLPLSWYDAMQRQAALNNQSLNGQMRQIVEDFLKEVKEIREDELVSAGDD